MTRKDYVLLAEAINAERKTWTGAAYGQLRVRAIESLAARIANAINADNPSFDIYRFMADCGFPQEEGDG